MSGEIILTVIGNLTADPELRYTQTGVAVANFTIASTARTLNKSTNEWEDDTAVFLPATVWREYAEHVAASLVKGLRVIASGILKERSYETKPTDGSAPQKRTVKELHVQEIGPALRYATATVQRSTSQVEPGRRAAVSGNDEPWSAESAASGSFLPSDAKGALV